MPPLWQSTAQSDWQHALDEYPEVVARQKVSALAELDQWYRDELPRAIAAREVPHVTHPELVRMTEWKMARGVWRAPNLVKVRGNPPAAVERASTRAFAAVPHPTEPIATLAALDGVGPATASSSLAAFAPHLYPFFDELVAAQVPGLGKLAWTLPYYARYAAALRTRAEALGGGWTPVRVERALWSHAGGKAGRRG